MNHLPAVKKKCKLFVFIPLLIGYMPLQAQLTANFMVDKESGCSPLTVSFTNLTTGASAGAVYHWDFGNGNTSSLKNPGAIYKDEKTYTVTLTVTDGTQTSSKTGNITVYKKPAADFSVSSLKVCIPDAATFTSNSSAGDGFISSYSWDFGDGTAQQGYGNSMSHYYSYEQKPTVSLTVTNSYGCYNSVTKPAIVEVLGRINPVFTASKDLLCSLSEAVQFTNNSTGPGTLAYKWDFGDGTSSALKDPSHNFTTRGVYSVKLTVSNTDGCSSASWPVSVNAAYFNTDFTGRPLCREVGFTSTSYLYPNNCFWQFGDGSLTNTYNFTTHVYAAPGTYNVTLINTYNTCKDTVSKTVKVEDLVNFNSSIISPSSLCRNEYFTFKSNSAVNPGSSTWEFGDGGTAYGNEVSHIYYSAGTYTVKLTNTFGTCKEVVTKDVVVNDLPDPKGFITDYGGICGSPVKVKFQDTTSGAVKWEWRIDNFYNNVFSTQQNTSYNFTNDGTYLITLTVTNAAGCSRTTSKYIAIYRPVVGINYISTSSPRGNYDCDSLRIRFSSNANQPLKDYLWNFGDATSSTETTPEHNYTLPGTYSITLNYTTESGCKGTASYNVRVFGKPKADFNYFVPCGNSLALQFSDKSYYSDNWLWTAGGNNFGYGPNAYNTFPDTGKYNVRFISYIGHCSDTITKEVYANVLPSSVYIARIENTCDGNHGTVSFDQRSLRINSGTWNFGDGTIIPYDTSVHLIKHTYTATGRYFVTLTGISGNCTLTDSRPVFILLKQTPILTADKTEICSNDFVNIAISNMETNPYTGNVPTGQYYILKFEYGDGTAFNGGSSNYYWNYNRYSASLNNFSAGTTKFRAIIANGYTGCNDTTNYINLKVNGPIAGFKTSANNICYKTPFVFEDTSKTSTNTPLKTWQWDFGDGKTATYTSGGKVEHLYDRPGYYYVRLIVTDAAGCSSNYSYNVNARGPEAAFTASGLYVPNVPLNTTVYFYNYTNSGYSNSVDYTWQYGDGTTSNNYYGSHVYTQAGVNTVRLIANDPSIQCADTAIQVITVKDFNTAFSFSTNYVTNSTCPPVMVRINNLSVGYTKLLWDFGDGTTSSDQYYPSHTYYEPGVYKIILYTYGYNGLTGTYIDSVTISQPSAQITADALQGCTSKQITLRANADNTASYLWDFGDGTVKSGADTFSTHVYLTPGVYQPKLITRDIKGCATSTELADKIIIDSLYIAIKGIPAQICDSSQIFFTPDVKSVAADLAQQPLVYHWDFGTGNAADTANTKNAMFNYNKPGTYTVKFSVASPFGCAKEVSEDIIVHKKAKGSISGPAELCEGQSASFTGSASQAPVEWMWTFDNGNTGAVQNPASQTFSTPKNYDIRLIVKYDGCSDTTIRQLAVHPNPVVSLSSTKTLLCLGESVQLTATGGISYLWKPSAGLNNTTIATPSAAPAQTTTYIAEVTNNFGCKKSDSLKLTVVQPFSLTMANDTFVCKTSSVQLKAQGAASYQWINNTNGLNNTQVANPIASPVADISYTVVGTDAYNCFKDTATIKVIVQPLPGVVAEPDIQMLAADSHQLTAVASNDVVQWLWSPKDYLSCTNCPSPVTTPKTPIDYTVTVKNQYGCAASDTVRIKLQCSEDFVFIPGGFTPNNDGKNDLFYIKGKGIGIIKSLLIFDRWGEKIFERTNFGIDDKSSAWDGKYKGMLVPVGSYVYLAEMQCESGEPIIKKGTVTVIY
jgi:gliding motility-associated-like protein